MQRGRARMRHRRCPRPTNVLPHRLPRDERRQGTARARPATAAYPYAFALPRSRSSMRSSMQAIFREHFDAFAQQHTLHPRELRAAQCISNCYTAALGGHVLACPEGHYSVVQYHACRHRSCPRCAERPRQLWVQAQLQHLLLPCPHFHVIFTLPHEFIALWEFNRAWMNQLLFDCARQSLLELCAEPRHLGATPGVLMALHTWGRTLNHHPHVHCLVSAGGIDQDRRWRASRATFLVPVKPLQYLFRGKLLAKLKHELNAQCLRLPPQHEAQHWRRIIATQYRAHWNVQISEPYAHGRGVALYLARYVKGGPLPKDRPLHLAHGVVSFAYTDHHDARPKTLHLAASEFISRVLWHAPPQGQHTVRRAGLYASALHRQHQLCLDQLTPQPMPLPLQPLACHTLAPRIAPAALPCCPTCKVPLVRTLSLLPEHRFGESSLPPTTAGFEHRPNSSFKPTNNGGPHLRAPPAAVPPLFAA